MRILLVNSNRYKDPIPVIPIGLCHIANAVEKAGYEVSVLDLCFSVIPKIKLIKKIKSYKPDIIGISIRNIDTCNSNSEFLLDDVKNDFIDPCRETFKGPIIIGGPSVGINGSEMLGYFDLEYAVQGDGERAIVEFIKRFENKKDFSGIKGLIIRKNDKIIENNEPDLIEDLNYYYPFNPKKYINLFLYRLHDSPIQVQSKRGCELKCSYCTYNRIEGESYRLVDPQVIADEIEYIVKKTGIRHIEFVDSTFNFPLDHAKNVLKYLIAKKIRLKITTMGLNAKGIDEEFVQLLKKSRFIDVSVTLESCCDVILKNLNKNFNREDILKACRLFKEIRMPVQWYLLLGAPGETEETIIETFETIYKNFSRFDMIVVGIGLRLYNGSILAEKLKKEGMIQTSDNFFKPVPYIPKDISLRKIKKMAVLESLRNISLFLIHRNAHIPSIFVFFRIFFKILFPREPYWRMYIYTRMMIKFLGIQRLIAFIIKTSRTRKLIKN
jgi:radical SAM superfamily enzyme YgiQ (UPF0313 family)